MNNYSLDADSSRWWWPPAAVGAVGAAAIAAILVLPSTGVALPGETRDVPPGPDHWSATVDPDADRPCFLIRAHWNIALDQTQPRCGRGTPNRQQWTGTLRPDLDSQP
ncbi:hypothetical protein SFC88_00655 [Nocardioides sp. HM23]|uniref:hypothetical protein n=1 Tax=Nocardioides bizhenqiangii TaxID=3095076 RepID=UPI002ACA532B|nr:hypothetical protein [Nocardioides sp. HM23]MDZ5619313.1 hypothetical protein [Nocardioides sp. HM23]